jgi:hypothetical protein
MKLNLRETHPYDEIERILGIQHQRGRSEKSSPLADIQRSLTPTVSERSSVKLFGDSLVVQNKLEQSLFNASSFALSILPNRTNHPVGFLVAQVAPHYLVSSFIDLPVIIEDLKENGINPKRSKQDDYYIIRKQKEWSRSFVSFSREFVSKLRNLV